MKKIVKTPIKMIEESSDELDEPVDGSSEVSNEDADSEEEANEHLDASDGDDPDQEDEDNSGADSEEEVEDNSDGSVDGSEQDDEDNLDASDTESDIGDNSDEESEEPKTRAEIIKQDVLERYEQRQGKQLYIRFPHKIPNTEGDLELKAKELSPLITKVHKPRQKHARFCLVDFNTKEDRDATLKTLRNSIQKGELAKYIVNIPRTESIEFVNELAEKKIKSVENKKAKARLKKASKKSLSEKKFTATVVVLNLPKTTSLIQVRELFPAAVDIQIKAGKGKLNKDKSIAAVTLPSTQDARMAVKHKYSLGGNQLMVKFDNQIFKKKVEKSPQQKKHQPNKDKVAKNTKDADKSETLNKKRKLVSNDEASTGDTGDMPKSKKGKKTNEQVLYKKTRKVLT